MAKGNNYIELYADSQEDFEGISGALEQITQQYKRMLSGMLSNTKATFAQIKKTLDGIKLSKTVQQQVVKLKRAVMGFDQLNRLSKSSVETVSKTEEVAASAHEAAQQLSSLAQTVKEKILQPFTQTVSNIFQGTGQALEGLTGKVQQAGNSGNWFTSIVTTMTDALGLWNGHVSTGSTAAGVLADGIGGIAEKAVGADTAMGKLTGGIGRLGLESEKSTAASVDAWSQMQKTWSDAAGWFGTNVSAPMGSDIAGLWSGMASGASGAWENTKKVFSTTGKFFSDTFGGAWESVRGVFKKDGKVFVDIQDGVLEGFKETVNGLIGGINAVVKLPFSGLNNTLKKLREVKIGSLQPFKWLNWQVQIPQIPKLAQGAVLPANKPFLAMVGDQRHGTNIEAPLSTIQEAVALVMEDYAAGNMAGHEATVAVLREILEAVLGIHIGDEVIANAYDRYQHKRNAMTGG